MGESLSKTTSQKLDKNTIAMLKDSHLRISSYMNHRASVSMAPGEATEEKESGSHQGFSKSQLVHCLRESSPPKVDSAISQRLFTLMAGQKRKVYFTPFAAAYYIATGDAEALPHALFLVCDLNGDCAVSADDISLWLQAGGVESTEELRKGFVDAAAEQYKTREDVKEIPAEGMDETAFTAALSKPDVACSAELKKAFKGIVDRLTTANPMPKALPLARVASEAAADSEGVLSPRSTDDDTASVGTPEGHEDGKKKKKKTHHEHGKHKRSSTVAVVTSNKDEKESKEAPSELKKSTVVSNSQSAITEDFSDDEEELARRKPITFVIKSAEEAAAESSKVDISTLALKPPTMSQSLRVSSRGKRPSVINSQSSTPNTDIFGQSPLSPRSPSSSSTDFFGAGDATKTAQAQPFDSNSMFGDSPFGETKSTDSISSTSLFDNAPFSEPAKPADDKAASQTSLFGDNPFGEPAKPAEDKASSETSLFGDSPFGEPAKPADDKANSQTSLFGDNPFGEPAKPAEDKASSQTSLFGDSPFGEPAKPAEDKAASQTSLFGDSPFGEPDKPADDKNAKSQTSLFDNAFEQKPEDKPAESQTSLFDSSSFGTEATKTTDDKSAASQVSLFGETKPADGGKKDDSTSQTSLFDNSSPFGDTAASEAKPAASQGSGLDLFSSPPKTSESTTASEKQKKTDDLFSEFSSFSHVPQKPLPKPNEPTPKPIEEPKPAVKAESDNPFDDGSFMNSSVSKPAEQTSPSTPQQGGVTPAMKKSLDKGLVSLEGGKFDEACFAFRFLCGQFRESAPDKVATIADYYVACLAMKSLTTSLGAGQSLKDLPREKQDQLAAIATNLTQLKLHPTHKSAMLAVAAVFSDYAYAQMARKNGAQVPNSMTINCTHSCWKCQQPCDPSLPRCVSCGEPISLTADSLQIVTSENISGLRRCTQCHCFFSETNPSDTNCPLCDGALQ